MHADMTVITQRARLFTRSASYISLAATVLPFLLVWRHGADEWLVSAICLVLFLWTFAVFRAIEQYVIDKKGSRPWYLPRMLCDSFEARFLGHTNASSQVGTLLTHIAIFFACGIVGFGVTFQSGHWMGECILLAIGVLIAGTRRI
jgi:hypothetical protein